MSYIYIYIYIYIYMYKYIYIYYISALFQNYQSIRKINPAAETCMRFHLIIIHP